MDFSLFEVKAKSATRNFVPKAALSGAHWTALPRRLFALT
jgi:hypothetical protein